MNQDFPTFAELVAAYEEALATASKPSILSENDLKTLDKIELPIGSEGCLE
jgi:hypothetical protein